MKLVQVGDNLIINFDAIELVVIQKGNLLDINIQTSSDLSEYKLVYIVYMDGTQEDIKNLKPEYYAKILSLIFEDDDFIFFQNLAIRKSCIQRIELVQYSGYLRQHIFEILMTSISRNSALQGMIRHKGCNTREELQSEATRFCRFLEGNYKIFEVFEKDKSLCNISD